MSFRRPFPCLLILLLVGSSAASALEALSKEELTPFCENTMLWQQFNVSPDQCLAVAVPCSQQVAKDPSLDMMQATAALYTCVFDKLGLENPMAFGPEDSE